MEHKEKKFFPLFVDLTQKKVIVIGGGKIAARRIKTLLTFAGEITVIAPTCTEEIEALHGKGEILYKQKKYEAADIENADVVLVVTDDYDLNEEIYKICKEKNILVNVASNQEKCDFHFPGILEYEDVIMGFNAHGKNHKKVRKVREMIQEMLSHKGSKNEKSSNRKQRK